MSRRLSFIAYAALLLGVISFASSFSRTTSGQQDAAAKAGEGRYRLAASGDANGGNVFVADSVTGRTWSYSFGQRKWIDLGTPTQR